MELFQEKSIIVIEDNEKYGYHKMVTANGEPYYVPDDELIFSESYYTDTVMIFPLNIKNYLHPSVIKSFISYRIRFDSAMQINMSFGPNKDALGWTQIQIEKSVSRVVYKINKAQEFVIQEVKDPMQRPTIMNCTAPNSFIGKAVMDYMTNEIADTSNWVLHNNM